MNLKNILRFVFSRKMLVVIILLLQLVAVAMSIIGLSRNYAGIYICFVLLSTIVVVYILNKNTNPAYQIAWIIPTLLMPIFGGIVYLIYSTQTSARLFKKITEKRIKDTQKYLIQQKEPMDQAKDESAHLYNLGVYMNNKAGFLMYRNTEVTYFKVGEEVFDRLIKELRNARHFIFLEFFIINQGKIWNEILEILKEKARNGVDVRVLYDGMGSQFVLPENYDKMLESFNIKCRIFNPFRPFLSSVQNNRDHRKIVVIDGHTAFNGGINLSDEYANIIERFGHWKDTAIMLYGEAAWSFTIMFLQMWDMKIYAVEENYNVFNPHQYHSDQFKTDGYVMPYGDVPTDGENVGELVYLDIINKAEKYVYITTPYLILDHEMITAMGFAAKSGVDIRIIVPGVPDKWYIHCLAQSYYKELIDIGVKLYEYTPGFIHAKSFVSDDTKAVVGTINLDYRSLYLHFECATFMYKTKCVDDVKRDFLDTLRKSSEITDEYMKKLSPVKKAFNGCLRIFGPLL